MPNQIKLSNKFNPGKEFQVWASALNISDWQVDQAIEAARLEDGDVPADLDVYTPGPEFFYKSIKNVRPMGHW